MSSVLNLRLKSLPWLNTDERGDVYEKLVANIIQTQPPYDDGKDLAEQTTSDDLKDWDVGNATSCDNGRVSSSQSTSAQPTTFRLLPNPNLQYWSFLGWGWCILLIESPPKVKMFG